MSQRPSHDDQSQFALWNRKEARAQGTRTVIVAHADAAIGESLALLLKLKGFAAVTAKGLDEVALMLTYWKPQAIFIDTRLGHASGFALVRAVAHDKAYAHILIVAMSNIVTEDSLQEMKDAGFDGLCRRPCPVWRLTDMLGEFFDPRHRRDADHHPRPSSS